MIVDHVYSNPLSSFIDKQKDENDAPLDIKPQVQPDWPEMLRCSAMLTGDEMRNSIIFEMKSTAHIQLVSLDTQRPLCNDRRRNGIE